MCSNSICVRKTRSFCENLWLNPTLDAEFNRMVTKIESMFRHYKTMNNTEDRCQSITEIYQFIFENKEDLYMFGHEFHQTILDRMNHFLDLDGAPEYFKQQMYVYKIALLPYIRKH